MAEYNKPVQKRKFPNRFNLFDFRISRKRFQSGIKYRKKAAKSAAAGAPIDVNGTLTAIDHGISGATTMAVSSK